MANTPDRQAQLAKALRDNLKRRKEQQRQRQADPRDVPSPTGGAVDKADGAEGEPP
jgi:hypothetical protein